MRSLQLHRPNCPFCGAPSNVDWTAVSNVLRIPLALLSALVLMQVWGIARVCPACGHRFVSDD